MLCQFLTIQLFVFAKWVGAVKLTKRGMLGQSQDKKSNQVGSIASKRLNHKTHCSRLRGPTFQCLR